MKFLSGNLSLTSFYRRELVVPSQRNLGDSLMDYSI